MRVASAAPAAPPAAGYGGGEEGWGGCVASPAILGSSFHVREEATEETREKAREAEVCVASPAPAAPLA